MGFGLSTRARDVPSLRLTIDVKTPSGNHYRWGGDERNPSAVPSGLSFGSTIPGGYDTFTCTLPRNPDVDYADLERLSTITVRSGAGRIVGQYRLEATPRTSGAQMSVTPNAVGWQAHLDDNKAVTQLYVDRSLGNWQAPSAGRRSAMIATAWDISDHTVDWDSINGVPTLTQSLQGPQTSPRTAHSEAWYDAGVGNTVGSIYYEFTTANASVYFSLKIWTATDDFTPDVATAELYAASGTGTYTPTVPRRWMMLQWMLSPGQLAGDGIEYAAAWKRLAVWGNHGLTKKGTAPNDGLYASDVLKHAIANYAPALGVSSETVTNSGVIIPHLTFREPTSVAEIISETNRYDLYDWAVWDGPSFYYYPRGSKGKRWKTRVAPAQLTETGEDTARLYNGVVVRFNDVDGSQLTVGPPNAPVNLTSTSLLDSDTANPANQLGIRRWALLDMGIVSTSAAAIQVGQRFLAQAKALDSSGQAQLTGVVEDDRGVEWPVSTVRAGDYISFNDASDTSLRRIVRCEYSHDGRSASIDLDAPPDSLTALLDQLQVTLLPLGL